MSDEPESLINSLRVDVAAGRGVLISDLDARLRRVEAHFSLPPIAS